MIVGLVELQLLGLLAVSRAHLSVDKGDTNARKVGTMLELVALTLRRGGGRRMPRKM